MSQTLCWNKMFCDFDGNRPETRHEVELFDSQACKIPPITAVVLVIVDGIPSKHMITSCAYNELIQ